MLAYATVGSLDFESSAKFYDAVLGALGHRRVHEFPEGGWIAYGDINSATNPTAQLLWLSKTPFNGAPATVGNGVMLAFAAISKTQVDTFHAAALANGGSCEGSPGQRDAYGPGMYLAYVRDPMGNKCSVIFRD